MAVISTVVAFVVVVVVVLLLLLFSLSVPVKPVNCHIFAFDFSDLVCFFLVFFVLFLSSLGFMFIVCDFSVHAFCNVFLSGSEF